MQYSAETISLIVNQLVGQQYGNGRQFVNTADDFGTLFSSLLVVVFQALFCLLVAVAGTDWC